MDLQTICYVSNIHFNLTVDELEKLFKQTKTNNFKQNITGILIYKSGNFLQILEGKTSSIKDLYKKILKDKRHKNVIRLIETNIEDRIFNDYNTGFSIITNTKDSKDLDNYVNWLENSGLESVKKLTKIIQDFLNK